MSNGMYDVTINNNIVSLYPNEYNGPGVSTPIYISRIYNDYVTNISYINLVGNLTYRFIVGFEFTISNSASGENDGVYTVLSNSQYSSGTNLTSIPVSGFVANLQQPGVITYQVIGPNQYTSLSLPGRGVLNYSPSIVNNFVSLLSCFANNNPPVSPVPGQLWFNNQTFTTHVYYNNTWNDINRTGSKTASGNNTTISIQSSGQIVSNIDVSNSNDLININLGSLSGVSSGMILSYTNVFETTQQLFLNGFFSTLQYYRNSTYSNLSLTTTNFVLSPNDTFVFEYDSEPPVIVIVPNI